MNAQVWRLAGLVLAIGSSVAWAQTEGGTQEAKTPGPDQRPSREEIMKRFDTDGDGVLSPEEREAMRQAMPERPGGPGGREGRKQRQEALVSQFDADGDGELSAEERATMQAAMEKRREERRQQREEWRQKMLERFDTDGDGELSQEEREAMREAMRAERPAPPPAEVEAE